MPSLEVMHEETHHGIHLMCRETRDSSGPSYRRLEGKVAIVTGGARGIGEATARLFAWHGAKVVVADVEDAAGELLAASLSPCAGTFVHCDVGHEPDVERLLDVTLSRHGRVDVFFNNAGVLGSQSKRRKSITELDADELDRVMRVNVRGVALGMKHAARAMVPRQSGCIISTASVAGVMGGLGPHAYTASKHAIVGLTKNAACELGAHGVRVNCISPFGVATAMLVDAWRDVVGGGGDEGEEAGEDDDVMAAMDHLGRRPSAEEVEKTEALVRRLANLKGATLRARDIAEAALYLASEESKYVSGHNLVVDGGVTSATNLIGL